MGIGLVFFGMTEPLMHFVSPRPDLAAIDPNEAQRAQAALAQTSCSRRAPAAWSASLRRASPAGPGAGMGASGRTRARPGGPGGLDALLAPES